MKRTLSLVLSFCLVLSLFTGILVSGAGAITYTDVAQDFWAYNEIYYLTDKGILAGDGTGKFRPKDNVTHIEFIKMIVATFNLTDAVSVNYTKIPQWARDGRYVEKAAAQGFLLPTYARDFDFTTKLTREEAVAMVMRYLDLDSSYAVSSSRYPDYSKISPAYRDYALIATGAGIIQGDDTGNFQPDRVLTRSEALRILYTAAGAIYDKNANRADTGANRTNATINRSVTLSGINFTGNVYVTEGAPSVTFTDCYINGRLIVRGKTNVTLDGTIVTDMDINDSGSNLTLSDDSTVNTCNVLATAAITIGEKASINTLAFKSGSRNSTVSGKGTVDTLGVNDSGIVINGVNIATKYYIARGFTATIDGVKYEAGEGKPVKGNVLSATVSAALNSNYYNASSIISVNVKTSEAGTVYVAAWPVTDAPLDASQIRSVATATAAGNRYGFYQAVAANVAATISVTVPGSYENFNVGMVFIPTGSSNQTTGTPYYNKSALSATAQAMVTTAPAATNNLTPTWTLNASPSTNQLILTFSQPMGMVTSTYPLTVADLSNIQNVTLKGAFRVYEGTSTPIDITSVTFTTSSTSTIIYLNLGSVISTNRTYTVTINSNITNKQGVAPKVLSASVSGAGAMTGKKPTITASNNSTMVSSTDSIWIYYPDGCDYVRYQITADGTAYSEMTVKRPNSYTRYAEIPLRPYSSASKIVVKAWALDSTGKTISDVETQTFYMGTQAPITINSTAYYGTNNNVNVTETFYVGAPGINDIPGYTAVYRISDNMGTRAVTYAEFVSSHPVPQAGSPVTFIVDLYSTTNPRSMPDKTTSVTVYSSTNSYTGLAVIIDGVAYYTNTTIYRDKSYTVDAYAPSGYTLRYFTGITDYAVTRNDFVGTKAAPPMNSFITHTVEMLSGSTVVGRVTVTVNYGGSSNVDDAAILIDGVPYNTDTTIYRDRSYSVQAYIPAGYTAYYYIGSNSVSQSSFSGNKSAPGLGFTDEYTIQLYSQDTRRLVKSISVTVRPGSGSDTGSVKVGIAIDGITYYENTNLYRNTPYYVSAEVPYGYTAYYYVNGSSISTTLNNFSGNKAAPTQNAVHTYMIELWSGSNFVKRVTVSVSYGSNGGGTVFPGTGDNTEPSVKVGNDLVQAGGMANRRRTGTSETMYVSVPSYTGCSYTISFNGGSESNLAGGSQQSFYLNTSTPLYTVIITARQNGAVVSSWVYTIHFVD